MDDVMTTSKRGGVRVGAGRKKSEDTKMKRIPVGAEDAVNALLKLYRSHNESSLRELNSFSNMAAMELCTDSALVLAFALTNGRATINHKTLADCYKAANAHLLSSSSSDKEIIDLEDNEDWVGFD